MSETLQAPAPENHPKTRLTTELEKAKNSLRGRITRRLGELVTGKDSPIAIVSGKEARFAKIESAGTVTVEGSLDEARGQLESVRGSRKNRFAKSVMKMMTGNQAYMTKWESALTTIASELQSDIGPRESEIDEAYAMNDMVDAERDEVRLYEEGQRARAMKRRIDEDIALHEAAGPSLSNADPEVLDLRRRQNDASLYYNDVNTANARQRWNVATGAAEQARTEQSKDKFYNPRPARIK